MCETMDSAPENNKASGESTTADCAKPRNVSVHLWEKFKALEKRTNEVTKRSTEKRIKHLQKTALQNVAKALHQPEDREIVKIPANDCVKCDSTALASPTSADGSTSRKRHLEDEEDGSPEACTTTKQKSREEAAASIDGENQREREWKEVRGLMGVNDHLAGVSHGNLGPKTVLETKIEAAIADGDFKKAEELSDHMASREFGEKVAKAIDAKNFLHHKQTEEQMAKAKRKNKLQWGFEAKHRWETKSNM